MTLSELAKGQTWLAVCECFKAVNSPATNLISPTTVQNIFQSIFKPRHGNIFLELIAVSDCILEQLWGTVWHFNLTIQDNSANIQGASEIQPDI